MVLMRTTKFEGSSYAIEGDHAILDSVETTHSVFIVPKEIPYEGKILPVKYIGRRAFSKAKTARTIQFEKGSQVVSIDQGAFPVKNCTIRKIILPPSIGHVKPRVLKSIPEVVYPENGNNLIKQKGFVFNKFPLEVVQYKEQKNTNEVEVRETVVGIGPSAFTNCEHLEKIKLPSSLKSIGVGAFEHLMCLSVVELAENSQLEVIEPHAFSNCGVQVFKFPSTLKKIGELAFYRCALCYIEFPRDSNLKIICRGAFQMTDLDEVHFPDSLEEIEEGAFKDVFSLEEITFDEGSKLKKLHKYAFQNDSELKKINAPKKLQKLTKALDLKSEYD